MATTGISRAATPSRSAATGPRTSRPRSSTGRLTDYRVGGSVGAGSKFYVSPNAYINAGLVASYAKPSTTVTFLAGFGIDF